MTLIDALFIWSFCEGRDEHTGACCLRALEQISQLLQCPVKGD